MHSFWKLHKSPHLGSFSFLTLTNDLLCMISYLIKWLYLTHVKTGGKNEWCFGLKVPKKKQVLGPGIRTNEVFMHQTAVFDPWERIQGSNKFSSVFPCTCLLLAKWILIGSDNFQLINGEAYIYCFILAALLLLLATGTSLSVSYSSNCIFLWVIATIDVFITSNTNMEALAFLHLSDF